MDSSAKSAPKAWPGIIPVKTIRLKLWRACRLRSLQGMSPKDGVTLINCLLVWQFKSGASVCRHKSFKCITSCSGARRWNSTPAAPPHAVTSALLLGLRTRRATDSNSKGTASRPCCRRGEHFILCTRKLGGLTFVPLGRNASIWWPWAGTGQISPQISGVNSTLHNQREYRHVSPGSRWRPGPWRVMLTGFDRSGWKGNKQANSPPHSSNMSTSDGKCFWGILITSKMPPWVVQSKLYGWMGNGAAQHHKKSH